MMSGFIPRVRDAITHAAYMLTELMTLSLRYREILRARPGQPIAMGKGSNSNNMLPMDFEHTDPVCGNIETAVRVRLRKIG